ncbi:hypothetical protein LCGC14_0832770 [marine sediment metagenome]|uniref:Uncharacterized protein n=1 Tax=marine sediment metagenome TaxID=412755 RepID=A0A0F9Q0M5_9ZZZZ
MTVQTKRSFTREQKIKKSNKKTFYSFLKIYLSVGRKIYTIHYYLSLIEIEILNF